VNTYLSVQKAESENLAKIAQQQAVSSTVAI